MNLTSPSTSSPQHTPQHTHTTQGKTLQEDSACSIQSCLLGTHTSGASQDYVVITGVCVWLGGSATDVVRGRLGWCDLCRVLSCATHYKHT